MICWRNFDSPIGTLTVAATQTHITGLWMEDQKHFCATLHPEAIQKEIPILTATGEYLQRYFDGQDISGNIPPLLPQGTPFQTAVWDLLREIPYGKTVTYGQIAEALAKKNHMAHMSAQAVGNAVGRNPISILIPCHRVVGSKGQLTGYAGGIDRKRFLLALEQHSKL